MDIVKVQSNSPFSERNNTDRENEILLNDEDHLPRKASTNEIPRKTSTNEKPRKTSTNEIPRKTSTNEKRKDSREIFAERIAKDSPKTIYSKIKDNNESVYKGENGFSPKNLNIPRSRKASCLTNNSLTTNQLDLVDDKSEIGNRESSQGLNTTRKKKLFKLMVKLASTNKTPQGKIFKEVLVMKKRYFVIKIDPS